MAGKIVADTLEHSTAGSMPRTMLSRVVSKRGLAQKTRLTKDLLILHYQIMALVVTLTH